MVVGDITNNIMAGLSETKASPLPDEMKIVVFGVSPLCWANPNGKLTEPEYQQTLADQGWVALFYS